MESMVRPHEPPRNRLEPFGTGTIRDRFQMKPKPGGTGTGWNRNGTGPTRNVAMPSLNINIDFSIHNLN